MNNLKDAEQLDGTGTLLSRIHFCWASNQQNVQRAASAFKNVVFYCYNNMQRDWSDLHLMQALPDMVANLVGNNTRWEQVNVECKPPFTAMEEQGRFLTKVHNCWHPEGDEPYM